MQKRKKPFSAKKKKQQLQEKRHKQQALADLLNHSKDTQHRNQSKEGKPASSKEGKVSREGKQVAREPKSVEPTHEKPLKQKKENRLNTVFEKEPQEEIDKRKILAQKPLVRLTEFPSDTYYGELIDIPLRPAWDYSMSKDVLEENEQLMFKLYLENIYKKYPRDRLNYFEHNLEVWRQLWRVCEISDILFVLADSRHPLFHFPPSLYRYVVKKLQKPLVLVLTKTDLVPEKNVLLWLNYFKKTFRGLLVTAARSFERDTTDLAMGKKRRRQVKKKKQLPTGVRQLLEFINPLILERGGEPLDLPPESSSQGSEEEDEEVDVEEETDEERSGELNKEELERLDEAKKENHYETTVKEKNFITLGFIGHPNVGKSTLINTLNGKKVCSTSRTPGHTKYKQTVFLNSTVMLCDCPGLVFPACDVPKVLQVVCGIFPIAQVREPYSIIQYIAERVPLENVYRLDKIYEDQPWTAWEICESYAEKRGYHTQRGRPDTHRAGLEILRDHLDGRVVLYFSPNSAKIDVNVYEEGQKITETKESSEEQSSEDISDEKSSKKVRRKKRVESEENSDEESNSDAAVNPFAVLGDE